MTDKLKAILVEVNDSAVMNQVKGFVDSLNLWGEDAIVFLKEVQEEGEGLKARLSEEGFKALLDYLDDDKGE